MNTEAKQLEEEWVINTPSTSFRPRPSMSNAVNLKLKADSPHHRQRGLSHEAIPFIPKRKSDDRKADNTLESICKLGIAIELIEKLVDIYNTEKQLQTKVQKAAASETRHKAMKAGLSQSDDPVGLIVQCIDILANTSARDDKKKMLDDKCVKTIGRELCDYLEDFIYSASKATATRLIGETTPDKEKALISLEEDGNTPDTASASETDLIVFQDVQSEEVATPSSDAKDEVAPEEVITIADLQRSMPDKNTWRNKLINEKHQTYLTSFIEEERGPLLLCMCLKTFKLPKILAIGQPQEEIGRRLIQQLYQTHYYLEALNCLETLKMVDQFSFEELAFPLFKSKSTAITTCIVKIASFGEQMRDAVLTYIDTQLMYTLNGSVGIVSPERLTAACKTNRKPTLLPDLHERRTQKDLANWGVKVMDMHSIDHATYLFIYLTQRYVSLRWLISQRACQQAEENDYSIEASSNYNGLIYVLCQDESLQRLAIKEFMDMQDPYAAPYFAEKFQQQPFYDQYLAMPISQRVIGSIPGEQNSRSRVYLPRRKKAATGETAIYSLPQNVQLVIIDNSEGLVAMRTLLRQSRLCGLDTEWIPHLAKDDLCRTSLMQVGSELGVVFLMDMVKLSGSNHGRIGFDGFSGQEPEPGIQQETFEFLKDLFTDQRIIKLAYDFNGDITMLAHTFPGIQNVQMQSFLDFANLNSVVDDQVHFGIPKVKSGLTGVTEIMLNRVLNKKQQLSNWEQRPLSDEQTKYAAGDAYCLIETFYALCNMNHPVLWNEALGNGPGSL